MENTPFTEAICPAIQEALINITKDKTPSLKRTPTGYLDAVVSVENMAGVSKIPLDQGNGKIKAVKLTYIQRGCEDDIASECLSGCQTEIEKLPKEQIVEITKCKTTKGIGFDELQMRRLCEKDSQFMKDVVNSEVDALVTSINADLIATQAVNFGAFVPAQVPPYHANMINDITGAPIYLGEKRVLEQFANIGVSNKPLLIGAGKLDDYALQQKLGCCNDQGIDLSKAGNFSYYRDRRVGTILGDVDDFIGLAPGSVQLLTSNAFVGDYKKVNDFFVHDTFVDPKTGLRFDFLMVYDPCTFNYVIKFGLAYELWFMPSNSYAYCDEQYGVNGTLYFHAD